MNDVNTAKSRIGYIISFSGCPITWASKLQTQIVFITIEAEYIALSQSLREVIPMSNLLMKISRSVMCSYSTTPKLYCKSFEENSGALEFVKTPKMRHRKKHINLVFHQFRVFFATWSNHNLPRGYVGPAGRYFHKTYILSSV
jgi:hypothetical protein